MCRLPSIHPHALIVTFDGFALCETFPNANMARHEFDYIEASHPHHNSPGFTVVLFRYGIPVDRVRIPPRVSQAPRALFRLTA